MPNIDDLDSREDPADATEDTGAVEENDGFFARVSEWLWHVDGRDGQNLTARPRSGQQSTPEATPFGQDRAPNAQVDRAVPVPVAAPVPPANRPHEPNIQFGIDLNDPNAIDDAEDLEGILELIGMEGPITGMVQNLIFSIFLITFTLLASVWCPYIWGKNALLVMSHPFGVFIKAPLFVMSHTADMLVDLLLLIIGIFGLIFTSVTRIARFVTIMTLPMVGKYIKVNTVENFAKKVTQTSSLRLEKALSITLFHLRPDLPTVSMQSHHALRVFKTAFSDVGYAVYKDILDTLLRAQDLWRSTGLLSIPTFIVQEVMAFPNASAEAIKNVSTWMTKLSNDLIMPVPNAMNDIDLSLHDWDTKDKIMATVIGYFFLALSGSIYLKLAHLFLGLKKDEKVEGVFADSLRQAGGVMKVIFIIGIEMLFFPLYCGFLLDVALLPLFKDATLMNRLQFVTDAPITGIFVHWFIGTCYMFHFALFVSMCRKIMRKGVLYFIRDPDDPTFHPVRDVLERPVLTQLSKIAFSALVYGGLLLVCLGGVIWTLSSIGNIFPIQWATNEPRLAFPADVMFFNLLLPLAIRTAEPSKRIASMYEWWFRKCARYLRLSHFLFGDEHKDEMTARSWFSSGSSVDRKPTADQTCDANPSKLSCDGYWVRAPASDAVRIPKGTKVFLEVDVNNNRLDGQEERAKGLHGREDERFAKIFVPTKFRARIALFIFLVWSFASCTGAAITLVPLSFGRAALSIVSGSSHAPNDLYAFTVGLQLTGVLFMIGSWTQTQQIFSASKWANLASDVRSTASQLAVKIRYFAGLLYLIVTFCFLIPILLSLIAELYVHMPVYGYIVASMRLHRESAPSTEDINSSPSSPTIHLAQSWTLGVLLFRLLLRAAVRFPDAQSRLAIAVQAIIRRGILHPDVGLATRALAVPILSVSTVLLAFPVLLAQGYIIACGITGDEKLKIYRHAYPVLLFTVTGFYFVTRLRHKIDSWQVRVRDEIYLVGERLHNFTDTETSKTSLKRKQAIQDKRDEVLTTHHEDASQSEPNGSISTGMNSEQSLRHRNNHTGGSTEHSRGHETM